MTHSNIKINKNNTDLMLVLKADCSSAVETFRVQAVATVTIVTGGCGVKSDCVQWSTLIG